MKHNQLGRFRIDSLMMATRLDDVAEMMKGLVIKRISLAIEYDAVEYMAIGETFDEVEQGGFIPLYFYEITTENGKIVSGKWVR